MAEIHNPILPGFFPDPSLCRVGENYYIANSSFERFPGVPLHHSKDLMNWRFIGHALTRKSQLDLCGVPDSAGVWAPSLSCADGQFWLVYTNVRNPGMGRPFKGLEIFLTTATDIAGPWSEPVELNSVGFDPSLPLQKAGHGELIETSAAEWHLAHLASRPLKTDAGENPLSSDKPASSAMHAGDRCMLGRETCLQRVEWRYGWLRIVGGGHHPKMSWPAPEGLAEQAWPVMSERDDFDSPQLGGQWSSLRASADESWLSLNEPPGWLRLRGRDSLHSFFDQSLIARRVRYFQFTVETCLEFSPANFMQSAGLICYYNTRTYF